MIGEGSVVKLAGVVRLAHDQPLRSQLKNKPAVCWEVREGLHDQAKAREGQDFWVDTDQGPVLIVAQHLQLDARAERSVEVLAIVDAEIDDVSSRLREIKKEKRTKAGPGAAELNREQKRLAKVATLLCAIRAQARGRVHLSGTLASQQEWIRKNAHLAQGGPGGSSAQLAIEGWEIAIEEGQSVEVEGICLTEAIPPGLASTDGYRSRLTGLVMRGSEDSPLRVIGKGAIAASLTERGPRERVPEPPLVDPGKSLRWTLGVGLALVALLVWALTR